MPTRETPTHSPAPWALDPSSKQHHDDLILDAKSGTVAATYGLAADDRLILKAPDLLAACRAFVLRFEAGADHSEEIYDTMKALVDHIDGGGE